MNSDVNIIIIVDSRDWESKQLL